MDGFKPGFIYDVGPTVGCLFLAEGWAEPVTTEDELIRPRQATAIARERVQHGRHVAERVQRELTKLRTKYEARHVAFDAAARRKSRRRPSR